MSSTCAAGSATVQDACGAAALLPVVRRSLLLVFCADALSMPVHWFYNPGDITRYFPPRGVAKMEAAPAEHPSSIMRLHSTSGGGRTAASRGGQPEVVGPVILKGKAHLWGRPGGHYHHGMPAGENTLNAWCARLMLRDVLTPKAGRYDRDTFLDKYIAMMTADPPQHPDTYAESYHRGFFANLVHAQRPRTQCGAVTHDTPSVGGLVTIAPLALSELVATQNDVKRVQSIARAHLSLTHPDDSLAKVCDEYVALLSRLLYRKPEESDKDILLEAASKWIRAPGGGMLSRLNPMQSAAASAGDLEAYIAKTDVRQFIGGVVSPACYITDSWPAVLFMATKYATTSPVTALLANTNAGGENCHRGSVLGSIVGLTQAAGTHASEVDALAAQLKHDGAIRAEIDEWAKAVGL